MGDQLSHFPPCLRASRSQHGSPLRSTARSAPPDKAFARREACTTTRSAPAAPQPARRRRSSTTAKERALDLFDARGLLVADEFDSMSQEALEGILDVNACLLRHRAHDRPLCYPVSRARP